MTDDDDSDFQLISVTRRGDDTPDQIRAKAKAEGLSDDHANEIVAIVKVLEDLPNDMSSGGIISLCANIIGLYVDNEYVCSCCEEIHRATHRNLELQADSAASVAKMH